MAEEIIHLVGMKLCGINVAKIQKVSRLAVISYRFKQFLGFWTRPVTVDTPAYAPPEPYMRERFDHTYQ